MMFKHWQLHPSRPKAHQFARDTGLTRLEAQLLFNRGIPDISSARAFLHPRLSDLLDPSLLKDMDRAVDEIVRAMEAGDPITIYGDYDADGLTSTALLLNVFSNLGIQASYHIPDRLTEGHGLNPEAVERIARDRGGLMITVDCGTSDMEELALADRLGLRVIVTDHHQVPRNFHPPCPVVNPHRPDSSFPFKDLAGVGLAFFLAVALRRALRECGWFRKRPEPDLRPFLDLVALGTVADMVPLKDQNRILVRMGIEKMKGTQWPGIQAIGEVSEVDPSLITSYDLAFKFAPRINASGRLGDAEIGVKTLTTSNPVLAGDLAGRLNAMNLQRREIEQDILDQVKGALPFGRSVKDRKALVFSGRGWHRGVLGIVASRLVSRYHRPVLMLGIENGKAVGSGRSIEGFNLFEALTKLEPLLERYGGHHRAAGFTLKVSNLKAFEEEMERLAADTLHDEDLVPSIEVDAEATLEELNMQTVRRLDSLAPFGAGNPPPQFLTQALEVVESRVVGEAHLKLRVRQGQIIREAIGFGFGKRHPLGNEMLDMVHIPEIDHWQGRERLQLRIVDLAIAGEKVLSREA